MTRALCRGTTTVLAVVLAVVAMAPRSTRADGGRKTSHRTSWCSTAPTATGRPSGGSGRSRCPRTQHPLSTPRTATRGDRARSGSWAGSSMPTSSPNCSPSVGTRACTVPLGKYLFFPIVNSDDSYIEEISYGNQEPTIAYMRAAVTAGIDGAMKLSASIDGIRSVTFQGIASSPRSSPSPSRPTTSSPPSARGLPGCRTGSSPGLTSRWWTTAYYSCSSHCTLASTPSAFTVSSRASSWT